VETYHTKIKGFLELKEEIKRLKAEGKRIVFTNGCFDLLHPGHTRYLEHARSLGDYLVVAVNSDGSVRAIKGEERPVMGEEARAELLAALECTDAILIFEEETPLCVIEQLKPDVLVKGGDWKEDSIVGADVVRKGGGDVRSIPLVSGYSSTKIIESIRRGGRV
jgi:D-beta-D-heptose 7-phosphate kinase/D-beta-D-heptose 1-phosphate adenosyltransferase